MKEFDIDLIDKLKELIEAKDSAQVLAEIKDLHPADIAELVSELDDTDDSLFLLQLLDNETVADVLEYVQYSPKNLVRRLEIWVAKSVKEGKITLEEGKEFISNYRAGLYGYTYLE